ncbi:pyridoxine/pyridoxamine 5'-phosphate oxidase [Aspergillus clavatus NRRL 1]|uniref:pyridoxal 5'-phosphate synthase n=1 Tax=Aspergillus clavatus (strain ATCC 1007 / CBS 513.65 / DSM 816 / NCTC 3887 / NRRL 1 / QM 1276 / 107) TaxID=344612 RepID=A1C8C0_ASPCL|nr:pyridoxamine 5'-phosphate oxidase [Aspergillus clavatus NRRL 1]EAW14641.1 pyridoxamine 5'-phosphate oxidase [Aspergillus clavatus NRRL 1]
MATHIPPLRNKLRNIKVLRGPFPETNFDDFPDTPQQAFIGWLDEAIQAGVKEAHSMTLSTVDEHGWADARVLILKELDERGWHFAARGDSPKAFQIKQNAHVALTFYWPEVGRSIRIRGKANQLPDEESQEDFSERPLGSRMSAVASKQSQKLESRDVLLQRVADVEAQMAQGSCSLPKLDWRLYAVEPFVVEFWQGSHDRLHQRVRFLPGSGGDGWVKELLWP